MGWKWYQVPFSQLNRRCQAPMISGGPIAHEIGLRSQHVYRVCTEGMSPNTRKGIGSPRRLWQMGHRTMDKPNLGGRTVPRHHVPKRARRSRKRTLRAATKTQRSVKPAEPTPRKRAIRVAARIQKPVKPTPQKWAIRIAAKIQKPIKPAEQTPRKQAPQIAAKALEPVKLAAQTQPKQAPQIPAKAAEPIQPAEQPQKKQSAPEIAAKVQEPVKPPAPAKRPEEEIVGDKGKRVPLDYLQDGAIEWGIKREGEEDSGT